MNRVISQISMSKDIEESQDEPPKIRKESKL